MWALMAIGLGLSASATELEPQEFNVAQRLWADFEMHMDGLHAHEPEDGGICLTGLVQRLFQPPLFLHH